MLNVSDATKTAFKSDTSFKTVRINFPGLNLNIGNDRIFKESLEVKESLMDKDSIEFVGCISSSMSVKISGISETLVGQQVKVYIQADNTDEICLFNGYVDSAKLEANKIHKKIIAYDALYQKGNIDVASWYNSLSFPISIKSFRNSLFNYIGLTQVAASLPADEITFDKLYEPKQLQALALIKQICQVNGVFGIVNRDGQFAYRILTTGSTPVYPANTLFPSSQLFPARKGDQDVSTSLTYYRKNEYEEFVVHPVDLLSIRESEDDYGINEGTGGNRYIIQGNIFTYNLGEPKVRQIARAIYPNVCELSYIPFKATNNGLPYLECGDGLSYETSQGYKSFTVLSRTFKGIQAQKDEFSARGVEYQNIFISDLKTKLDLIKKESDNQAREISALDERVTALEEGGTGFQVQSVSQVPTNPQDNTIYLIQGEIVTIQ